MKKLNNKSTHIFLKLIKKLDQDDYTKFESNGFIPLTLETVQDVQTDMQAGKLYSLSHAHIVKGTMKREPEMCFIVFTDPGSLETAVYPQMYRQDSTNVYEVSVHLEGNRITGSIPIWQASHCAIANIWLKNIAAQGFLSK